MRHLTSNSLRRLPLAALAGFRSGTNAYHGTAYYYTQNEALNANSWTNNRVGTQRPSVDLTSVGLFFQDDWKLTRRLTLNLGLRYELETPPTERYDRLLYSFDPAINPGITVPGVGALRGGVRFVNDKGAGRGQGESDSNNFGPRIGMAYALGKDMVVRGGYGIFFSSSINTVGTPGTDAAFSAVTPYVGTTGGDVLPIPGVSLSNPFPNGYVQPTAKSLGALTDLGTNVTFVTPERVLPYVQQYQVSVQKQFKSRVLAELAYVGTHSVKLNENLNFNEVPDAFLSNQTNVPNPFLGLLPPASTLGQGATVRFTQLQKAFPQFNNVTSQRLNNGRIGYNALQARAQKRFSKGLQLIANYTWSKSMQYVESSAVNIRHNNRAVSPIDYPQMVNIFMVYDLPAGRGRAWGKSWPRWLDAIAGGWQAAFTTHYRSGDALSVSDSNGIPIPVGDPVSAGGVTDRLGDRSDPATRLPANPYLSRTVWQRIPNFTISPEPARWSWLRGPSQWTQTAALTKMVPITERWKVELRALANSPFNHPVFSNPATNLASPATFGVITSSAGASTRTITFGGKLRF